MFEAMLISLGEYSLLKPEDVGRIYPDDHFCVPDYRVVLKDGTQWLIEVKNVNIDDPALKQQERKLMNRAYREKLEAYAAATGGELKLAVYWARWGIWTLISPERLIDENGDRRTNGDKTGKNRKKPNLEHENAKLQVPFGQIITS